MGKNNSFLNFFIVFIKYKENNPERGQRGKNLDYRGTKSSDLHVTSN